MIRPKENYWWLPVLAITYTSLILFNKNRKILKYHSYIPDRLHPTFVNIFYQY